MGINKNLEGTLTSHLFTKINNTMSPLEHMTPPSIGILTWFTIAGMAFFWRGPQILPESKPVTPTSIKPLGSSSVFQKYHKIYFTEANRYVWVFLNMCEHLKCTYKNWFEYRETLHPSPSVLSAQGWCLPYPDSTSLTDAGNGIPIEQGGQCQHPYLEAPSILWKLVPAG